MLVPGALALLPEYAGLVDPVAELRAACLAAVGRLGEDVTVLADDQGERVAAYLLGATDHIGTEPCVLVVANGSARRSEKAPGHLDDRAHDFDDALGKALQAADREGLRSLDRLLAGDLLAVVDPIVGLADLLTPDHRADVLYEGDPYGVKYWVVTWDRDSP